jgi:tetratricopeptide (TPR) repeat protein
VVTTNFDYVLDEIFQLCGVDLRPVIYGASASFARAAAGDGLHPLLKIHGDYLHDRIFTRRQYDARYAGEGRLRGELAELFSAFDFLFVGFSLKDRNVQQALAQAHAADRRAHFAILPAEDGATLAQRDAELAALGVSAIWYEGDHAQIENLLGFLANAALPGDLLLRLGAAFRNNAPAFAADAAEALMEARPFCHPYRLAFAWSEIDAGFAGLPAPPDQVDGLIARIDRAIGVAGDFGDAYAVRGMMNHARFNFAEAAADITRALEMATSERQAELFCLRGIMRYAQSDLEGARVDWEAAIADWDQLGERKLAAGYRVMLAMATSQLGDAEATANVLRELDLNDIEDSGDRRNARFMRLILLSQVPFQRLARRLGIGPPKRRFTKKILRLMIAALRSGIIRP